MVGILCFIFSFKLEKTARHVGLDQWTATCPGVVPASRTHIGTDSLQRVLDWCWARHYEYVDSRG